MKLCELRNKEKYLKTRKNYVETLYTQSLI